MAPNCTLCTDWATIQSPLLGKGETRTVERPLQDDPVRIFLIYVKAYSTLSSCPLCIILQEDG
jgi:hypothetical protein